MASTVEGRELTESHRIAQVSVSLQATADARLLWDRLDPTDLDGSAPYWLASNTIAVNRRIRESQQLAAVYLNRYREAEIGLSADVVLGVPAVTATALEVAGPVRVKQLIGQGFDRAEAHRLAFTKYAGIAARQSLMGGRLTVARTTGRDRRAIGWRRVTDGNPCAFCAMLAARGPVYRDASSAAGLQYHGHCGCSAEPTYSTWEASEREQQYVDAYLDARYPGGGRARSTKDTLAAMRESGLFRDSPRNRSTRTNG
jgi:hypothetical protein